MSCVSPAISRILPITFLFLGSISCAARVLPSIPTLFCIMWSVGLSDGDICVSCLNSSTRSDATWQWCIQLWGPATHHVRWDGVPHSYWEGIFRVEAPSHNMHLLFGFNKR